MTRTTAGFNRRRFSAGLLGLTTALTMSRSISPAGAQSPDDGGFDPASFTIGFTPVVEGLQRPVQFIDANDGSGRFLVVEQDGRVRIWRDGSLLEFPFLDISDRVSGGSEQGLLSIALSPDFASNGVVFVDYTDGNGDTQIERWLISAENADQADPASAFTVLSQPQPYPNHNGGLLLFGPDDQLYVGLGDGGSQGDPEGNGQRLDTWLGKILRIDVAASSIDEPYRISEGNPFAGREGALPEIWAYGLRNPWRFSFDRANGDLYIGDVGQNQWEEISFAAAGESGLNFGWVLMEGDSCYAIDPCDGQGLTPPIFAYSHDVGGCSVTGGYVYRGSDSALQGVYLCADYCSGLLWGVGRGGDGGWLSTSAIETGVSPSSFAEDAAGELYLVDLGGVIYRIGSGG